VTFIPFVLIEFHPAADTGYGESLEANLVSLLERAKSGRYRAPLVKRVHLPKGETETRPIGMPTVENKVLERAVQMLLEPVYEAEFLDCSYGFRPDRSPHQALEAVRTAVMTMDGGWVVDVDVRKYFDTIPHQKLREVLARIFHTKSGREFSLGKIVQWFFLDERKMKS
jgi:RNA-directed DNA polymerase